MDNLGRATGNSLTKSKEEVDTFPKLLLRNYQRWGGSEVAMRQKEFGVWQEYTWKDEYENTKYLSLGLISLGLQAGDKVAILGDSEPEWYWGELAVQAAGGIVVGLFTDAIPSELKYVIEHSDAKLVIAGDQEQVDKILAIKEEIPGIQEIIYWEPKGLRHYSDPILIDYRRVMDSGRRDEAEHPGVFEQNIARSKGEDIAMLAYTSGTTGLPKGIIMPYSSLINDVRAFLSLLEVNENDDQFSLLAPAWIGEQLWGISVHYIVGTKLCFAEKPETALDNVREISPRIIPYGPRQWESLVSTIQVKTSDASFIKRQLLNLCLPIGYKILELRSQGKRPNLLWRSLHFLATLMVFRPLRDKLGLLKTREPWTGSAALSPDTFKFLHAIGIPLRNTYATSEGGGFETAHRVDDIRLETVGQPIRGIQVRISDEGEILLGGKTLCRGYYKEPEKTEMTFRDGWFHSGDAGYFNDDGHLIWLDRVKELGELAGGVKYSPTYIEGKLKFSPYIKDVMVIGGKERDYVSAIINIDFENVGKWAEDHTVPYTTFVDLSQKSEVSELILRDVQKVNQALPEESRVKKYVCLHKEFDPDEGELTRTRKLRRGFVEQRYHELIDAIYGDKDEVKVEASVTYRDGRKGIVATGLKVRTVGAEGQNG